MAGHQSMAQLMQQHRAKQSGNVHGQCGSRLARPETDKQKKGQQQQKSKMKPYRDAKKANNSDGAGDSRLAIWFRVHRRCRSPHLYYTDDFS
jgi:hypothetical protein